jgi:hypothetical protein
MVMVVFGDTLKTQPSTVGGKKLPKDGLGCEFSDQRMIDLKQDHLTMVY